MIIYQAKATVLQIKKYFLQVTKRKIALKNKIRTQNFQKTFNLQRVIKRSKIDAIIHTRSYDNKPKVIKLSLYFFDIQSVCFITVINNIFEITISVLFV